MNRIFQKKVFSSAMLLTTLVVSDSIIDQYRLQQELDQMEAKVEGVVQSYQTELKDFKIIIDQLNENIQKDIENYKKELQKSYEAEYQSAVQRGIQEELDKKFLGEYRISFYDTSHNSQEGWGYQTASGVSLKGKNINDSLIACPPEIPLGTELYLEFEDAPELSGVYTCVDRGGAIKGNKIDVFYEDYNMPQTVWDMGIKYANVYIMGE